jgi:hypothetical protein
MEGAAVRGGRGRHRLRGDCRARGCCLTRPGESARSAFGLLPAVQSFGNLAASAVAGALWTVVSPHAAFLYLAGWMAVSLIGLALARH